MVPSLIPMKAGDRVKTDRRDAAVLAKGGLTAVGVWMRRMRPCASPRIMAQILRFPLVGDAEAADITTKLGRLNLMGL